MKSARILSCGARGTGLDHLQGQFSPVAPGDHGGGLVALSSLAFSVSVQLQGVPAGQRTGFKTASKMGLFLVKTSHFVPFCPIHFYLFEACETMACQWSMVSCQFSASAALFDLPAGSETRAEQVRPPSLHNAGGVGDLRRTRAARTDSRNPCGIRARDECTKRSGRSLWTVEQASAGLGLRVRAGARV